MTVSVASALLWTPSAIVAPAPIAPASAGVLHARPEIVADACVELLLWRGIFSGSKFTGSGRGALRREMFTLHQ